jgi:diguanylate cyclase (GGDEF)-like protein
VTQTTPTSKRGRPAGIGKQSISLTWTLLTIAVALLLGQAVIGFWMGRNGWGDLAMTVATALLVGSAVLNARASGMVVAKRNAEAESFSRLLQALSRSVSPNAVMEAIVHELGTATGADHVAVVQMRSGGSALDVTFVSMLPGAQTSNTVMPVRQLEGVDTRRLRPAPKQSGGAARAMAGGLRGDDPREGGLDALWHTKEEVRAGTPKPSIIPPRLRAWLPWLWEPPVEEIFPTGKQDQSNAREVANQIAYRLRDAYGLRNTLAAPLEEGDAIVGAIVLSRRTSVPWTESAVWLLHSAAGETSAALARVYSHQAAEVEARTDQLTRLPNRRYFDEYCTLLASRRRASDRVSILAVDVDHFKRLNDLYGHHVGDQVLRAIGNGIQMSVREEDVPARYGGEEFMVLLRNPSPGIAMEIGERIRTTVRDLDLIEAGVTDRVTVSVGVATGHADGEPISSIVERADRALYSAKRTGRDRVVEAWSSEID